MADTILFETDPRDYALELVEQGYPQRRSHNGSKFMFSDDVKEMLDANELSQFRDEDYYIHWEQEWEDLVVQRRILNQG